MVKQDRKKDSIIVGVLGRLQHRPSRSLPALGDVSARMNRHAAPAISPLAMLRSFWRNRQLIAQMTKREVLGRYRGSALGLLWSFLNPVLMLAVYTFVFSVVFKARWAGGSDSKTEFALVLFAGLLIFNLFAECLNRAPNLILGNVNYVKKIVFPIEILPVVVMGSAFFHMLISLMVWLLFHLIFFGLPDMTFLLFPIVILPFILLTLGLSWLLTSIGVFLRDVAQVIGVTTTVLMFLSPVFYPITALPEPYRAFMYLNPLTIAVEQARDVMIWGKFIDWHIWLAYLLISVAIAWLGFAWFQKTRKGFADVL